MNKSFILSFLALLGAMSVVAQSSKVAVAPRPRFHEIEVNGITGFQDTPMEPNGRWHVHDPTRTQPPVAVNWYEQGMQPGSDVMPAELVEFLGESPKTGVLMLGENGYTFGDAWKGAEYIKLKADKKVSSILKHAGTREIPNTLPRSPGHLKEWVLDCGGGPPTFSSFEVGGHLTEIALSGLVALRTQKTLEWDGEKMRANNAPEAQQFIQPHYRSA